MAEFTDRQKAVLEMVKGPAAPLFALHGIETKASAKSGYLNVARCPWCGHGDGTKPNYQCGVRETPGPKGLVHSFKCHHAHHSPTGDDTPHYADVLAAMGALSESEADWVKNLRAELDRQAMQVQLKNSSSELRLANKAFRERLGRRLRANKATMDWLQTTRGFSPAVIEHFQIGLGEPYIPNKETGEIATADALTAPLRGRDGQFYSKYVNYAVPDVTIDNRPKKLKAWSSGPARTYYSDQATEQKTRLFVCDGLKDLWALWDKLRGTELGEKLLLVTSTNGGSGYPDEWKLPGFWEQWEFVYLGHDSDEPDARTGKRAGDEHAKAIAKLAMREMRRVWPVGYKDWNDFFLAGKTVEDFEALLAGAYPLSLKELKDDGPDRSTGLHEATPVSLVGAFHNGYMYEPVDVLERIADEETGELLERYRTMVVRSDGTLHSVAKMPAPKGTAAHRVVYRLVPDGTLLDGAPKPRTHATWSWNSIQDFLAGKSKPRPLREMVTQIKRHLQASVWLPFENDYTLLACVAVATYVQSIFDAVPLLLVTGAAGTGKTQLGIAMTEVCANSPNTAVGQISAASIARLIDQTRGFVVLDDLESIGNRRGGDAQFGELIQALKLSYNKMSAIKFWTNMKTNALEQLNFFGIKLINNTQGVDAILGSRMFTIATRRMPEGVSIATEGKLSFEERTQLRNDLHVWAFQNAQAVAQAYGLVFPNKTTRSDEIAAPLKVVALLSGDEGIARSLDAALAHQAKVDVQPETPEQVLREALERIIVTSFEQRGMVRTIVTVFELCMQAALMVDSANFGKTSTTDLSDIESPEVVGRFLKQHFVKPGAEQVRFQLFGKYLRGYVLEDEFVQKVLTKFFPDGVSDAPREADPKDFCQGCPSCAYRERCDIRASREAKEGVRTLQVHRNASRSAH